MRGCTIQPYAINLTSGNNQCNVLSNRDKERGPSLAYGADARRYGGSCARVSPLFRGGLAVHGPGGGLAVHGPGGGHPDVATDPSDAGSDLSI